MNETPRLKTVGQRQPGALDLEQANGFLHAVVEMQRGQPLFPKGVYRFKTHEEADQWTMQMLTRPNRERPL